MAISGRPIVALCDSKSKNIGASKIDLIQAGSGVRLREPGATTRAGLSFVVWALPEIAFPVFAQHAWIEAGETISEDLLLCLDRQFPSVLQVEVRLVLRRRFGKNIVVESRRIIGDKPQDANIQPSS